MSTGSALQIGLVALGTVLCCVIVFLPREEMREWAVGRGISPDMARLALLVYVAVPVSAGVWAVRNWEWIVHFVRQVLDAAHA